MAVTYRACRRLAVARRVSPAARQPAPCWRCSRCSRRRRLSAWRAAAGSNPGTEPSPAIGGDAFDGARAFADLREQVELGPRPAGSAANLRSTRRLAAELRRAGVEDVRIQRPERNVVGVIPGRGSGYVLIGAHHDTKPGIPGFVGANDGASGVAVVLELARALPDPMPGPSIAIALFDGEEARGDRDFSADGKRGSTQYVDDARSGAQGSVPLAQIKAMVLFDMVGDCDLHVPLEAASDPGIYARFAAPRRPSSPVRAPPSTTITRPSWRPGSRPST